MGSLVVKPTRGPAWPKKRCSARPRRDQTRGRRETPRRRGTSTSRRRHALAPRYMRAPRRATGALTKDPELRSRDERNVRRAHCSRGACGHDDLHAQGSAERRAGHRRRSGARRTTRSPRGQLVSIECVQAALNRLYTEHEVEISVDSVGYRSAFIGAVLSSLPNVEALPSTMRVRCRR
jgi:hypothetical protein